MTHDLERAIRAIHGVDIDQNDIDPDSPEAAEIERVMVEFAAIRAEAVTTFVTEILHGDERHRQWLRDAGKAFVTGDEVPKPYTSKEAGT